MGLLLATLLNSGCAGSDEDAPRMPEHEELILAWEQGTNPWSDELFRRMNDDESKVNRYTLPELPQSREAWEKARPEILQQFKDYMYGAIPPPPDRLEVKLLAEKNDALDGLAVRREYRIYCLMNNGGSFNFDMLLYVPKNASTPPPVLVNLNFSGNQAYGPEKDIRMTRAPVSSLPRRWYCTGPVPKTWRGRGIQAANYVAAIKRGYAIATACYGEIYPDHPDGARQSIFTLFYSDRELRPDYEIPLGELKKRSRNYGAISGWAWGLSRMADALERENFHNFVVSGHSRLGKAALWVGANDERFKLVISNNSGCGGAKFSRRNFGETLSMLWHIRSYWFCDRMMYFAGLEDTLPVDQHMLLALIAPRALYVASSSSDVVADPRGEFLATRHASKIWKFYGGKGIDTDEMPPVNTPVGTDMVRYHVKEGKHSITAYDWQHYYDFVDWVFEQPKDK